MGDTNQISNHLNSPVSDTSVSPSLSGFLSDCKLNSTDRLTEKCGSKKADALRTAFRVATIGFTVN